MATSDDLWVLDGHCDSAILRFYHDDPLDFSPVERDYHVTLARMREGKMGGLLTMVGDKRATDSLLMIDGMHQVCAENAGDFALCLSAGDVRRAVADGKVAIVLTIEGQSMFAERIEQVRNWHRLGVRVFSITHGEGAEDKSDALQVSHSPFQHMPLSERAGLRDELEGLTDFARESLKEMGRLGIACDLAHVNDAAFWEVMECATGPVCVTHGSCAAVCPHTRNLTDEMMSALAERDGVQCLCFYGPFIDEDNPTLARYVDHVLHALEILGEDGVGIGTDYDGVPEGATMAVPEPSRMDDLWEALDKAGVSRDVMVRIAHDNLLRMLPE